MKLNIIKGKDLNLEKEVILGWNFTAENEQEEEDLSLVRNIMFFGFDDSKPKYAGRTDNPKTHLVQKMWYRIPNTADHINLGVIEMNDNEAANQLKNWNLN